MLESKARCGGAVDVAIFLRPAQPTRRAPGGCAEIPVKGIEAGVQLQRRAPRGDEIQKFTGPLAVLLQVPLTELLI
jgi:hypothetical protein